MPAKISCLGPLFTVVCEGVMDLSAFSPRPIAVTSAIGEALDTSFLDTEPTAKKFAFQLLAAQERIPLDMAVTHVMPVLLAFHDHEGMRLATSSETSGIVSRLPHESLENVAFVFALGDEATVKNVDDNWDHTRFIVISHYESLYLGGMADEFGTLHADPAAKDCILLVREVA